MSASKLPAETKPENICTERKYQNCWFVARFLCSTLPYVIFYWIATSYFSAWHCKITLLYLCWYVYDDVPKRGGRPNPWVKKLKIFRKIAEYFPISLEKTCGLDPDQKYIVGSHPHGGLPIGAFINFTTHATGFPELFPGIEPHLLNHPSGHAMPGIRELIGLLGMCDVSPQNIDHLMQKTGSMAVIVVGGMREAAMTDQQIIHLVINKRKGFVKMALKHGAHLVPSFTFGEADTFRVTMRIFPDTELSRFRRFVHWFIGYPLYMTEGRRGPLPYKVPLHTIVGKPIDVAQDSSPSSEKIDALHATYIKELCDLFENNKRRFGMDHVRLKLVD